MQLINKKNIMALSAIVATCALFVFTSDVFAGSTAKDLKEVSNTMIENIRVVANLIIIVSYVGGIGFLLAGVVQFKAHKDNPVQVPLSKPLVYLAVGAFLVFLPALINSAGQSIWGGGQVGQDAGSIDASKGAQW